MPVNLTITKDPSADRVRLDPRPLQAVVSRDKDPDGRFRVAVSASTDLRDLSGSDKSVTFEFLNAASRDLFETPTNASGQPVASPFKLQPGETLTLTLKQNGVRAIAKRSAGAQRFVLDAEGHPQSQFTLGASLRFIQPQRAGAGHDDLHMEC